MCPNGFYTFENEGADVLPRPAGMPSAIKRGIDEVKGYTPPVFKENNKMSKNVWDKKGGSRNTVTAFNRIGLKSHSKTELQEFLP